MCGIVGYIGQQQAGAIIYKGLLKLEYRGYDSAGIATLHNGLHLEKDRGSVEDIQQKHSLDRMPGHVGIGHSRWATHGGITKENAHPHLCCKKEIIVVHNGIIENYQELREELHGHTFCSETDTEVIPHLIEEQHLPLDQAVPKALEKLKGSYALLIMSTNEPEKIIAVRKESPLIIGLGADAFFAASDVMPFLEFTKEVVYLNDNEMAIMTPRKIDYLDLSTSLPQSVTKQPTIISWNAEAANKGEYNHYMIKEILEQPTTLKNALVQDKKRIDLFAKEIMQAKSLKLVACGTSRHAALIGRSLFNRLTGKQAEVYIASEFSYFADSSDKNTVILAVSQSGETADVLDGLRKAKAKGAKICSLVNVVGSTIDRLSDITLYLNCGPEVGVASTKAFLNQLALFYLIAYTMAGKSEEGKGLIKEIANLAQQTIALNETKMKELAYLLKNKDHVYFIARGVNFPIAIEGALKLKEISYIHAEGMPAGELKHGTLALIEKGTPVVLINPMDYTYKESFSNGIETKARGAFLIGLSNKNNPSYDYFIQVPTPPNELLYPLLATIPLQLLAYYAALEKGTNPDKPRNLAKSVTVK